MPQTVACVGCTASPSSEASFGALLAGPRFDGDGLRAQLAVLWEAGVPTKSNRREAIDCGMEKHRRRRCVENFFCRIKHFRRIATRYDQTELSYTAIIRSAAIWLALAQLSTRPSVRPLAEHGGVIGVAPFTVRRSPRHCFPTLSRSVLG